jgi:hypothetical protein
MRFVCGFCDGISLAIFRDRRQIYRPVFGTVQPNLREAGTLMPPGRAGRGRRSVRDEEYVEVPYVTAHLREVGTLMPPARVGRGRRSVWDEEYVPDTVRDGPSGSTRYNYSATGLS